MNPILAGLALPNALSAAHVAVNAVQAVGRPFSEALAFALNRSSGGHPGNPAESTLSELRVLAHSMRDAIERRMGQAFFDAGIRLDEKIHLRLNPNDGTVEATGDHPNRIAIEAVFAKNPGFGDDLHQLAAIERLLQAAGRQARPKGPLEVTVTPTL